MMNKTQARRLLRDCDRIEKRVKPEQFNLKIYTNSSLYHSKGTECGSAGCFLGWLPVVSPKQWEYYCGAYPKLRNREAWGIVAGEIAYGLDEDEGLQLFSIYGYTSASPSLSTVLARIRKFVADKGVL